MVKSATIISYLFSQIVVVFFWGNTNIKKTKLTDFQNIPFYSVIVFFGDCEFRGVSFIPKDTYLLKSPRVIEVVKKS